MRDQILHCTAIGGNSGHVTQMNQDKIQLSLLRMKKDYIQIKIGACKNILGTSGLS